MATVRQEVPREAFENIRAGKVNVWPLPSKDGSECTAGDVVVFVCGERRTTVRVHHVMFIRFNLAVVEPALVLGLSSVWTHADGDPDEEVLASIEEQCRRVRELSHPGMSRLDYAAAVRQIHRLSGLLASCYPAPERKIT